MVSKASPHPSRLPKGEGGRKMAKEKKAAKGAPEEKKPASKPPTPRLQTRYEKELIPALSKTLERKNRHALPKLEKIVINMGVGAAITEKKYMEEAVLALTQIAGQKPI